MPMKKSNTARRAWNILRLALLWARKGGVLRRRLMLNFPKYIKTLRHTSGHRQSTIQYGERQMSFDDTPVIHVRMHRPSSLRFKLPHIPCINPAQVDFDFDFDNDVSDEGFYYDDVPRKSFLKSSDEQDGGEYYSYDEVCEDEMNGEDQNCDDQGIDMKAEEFIAKFYQQMKLQRQISYLQCHDNHLSVDQNYA